MDPIVYGEYPKTMQEIVKDRLPKFTEEEIKMVKGSVDFVGINQYTSFYIYNPTSSKKPKSPGYQEEWHAGFAYEKNGVLIGPRANSYLIYEVPWGIYKTITYVKEPRYGNTIIFLFENDTDDPGNITLPKGLHDTNSPRGSTSTKTT